MNFRFYRAWCQRISWHQQCDLKRLNIVCGIDFASCWDLFYLRGWLLSLSRRHSWTKLLLRSCVWLVQNNLERSHYWKLLFIKTTICTNANQITKNILIFAHIFVALFEERSSIKSVMWSTFCHTQGETNEDYHRDSVRHRKGWRKHGTGNQEVSLHLREVIGPDIGI